MDAAGRVQTPEILANPHPEPQQIARAQSYAGRLKNFARLFPQARERTSGATKDVQREPVDRQTLLYNRNAAPWAAQIKKANQGDRAAQQAITVMQNKQIDQGDEEITVTYSDFQVFTVDGGGVVGTSAGPREPLVLLLRRIEEGDARDPRVYHQGFELALDYLKTVTFPRAMAAIPVPNFTARVELRSAPGDRSLVRDLGRYLPVFELRGGPASAEAVRGHLEGQHRRFRILLVVVTTVVAGALYLFWRLLRSEVELGRRRQDFVSAVTHELKTPLTSIRMYAELLEDRWVADPDKQHEYSATIRRESERLGRLITNVLDFARLERGQRILQRVPLDVAAVTREVLSPQERTAAARGGQLRFSISGSLGSFSLDRDAFTQILINLVDNALKYGDPTEPIDVGLTRTADELRLTVENGGEPISPRERRRIFDDFRRGRGRPTHATRGVGLGLALVRRFARAHGGEARCVEASRPGARFEVRFRS
jgi:signal transduction histidine kinase